MFLVKSAKENVMNIIETVYSTSLDDIMSSFLFPLVCKILSLVLVSVENPFVQISCKRHNSDICFH